MSQPKTYVFVSALAPNMAALFKKLSFDSEQVTLDEVANMINEGDVVINTVRHPTTLALIKQKVKVPMTEVKEYKIDPRHIIIAFGLAQRQEQSGQEVNISNENQLVILKITINSATPLSS